MFSGIVETVGTIIHFEYRQGCKYLTISSKEKLIDLKIGDSIAVNGVCLTVTSIQDNNLFTVTVVPETLRLTNIQQLNVDDAVNLEQSLRVNSRIGGHYMQGHVDGMGQIVEIKKDNSDALLAKISISVELSKYVIPKGFIGLDGMSITVIQVGSDFFTVTFIPHTQAVTVVNYYQLGRWVNIEVDMMGKYIEKLLGGYRHAIVN